MKVTGTKNGKVQRVKSKNLGSLSQGSLTPIQVDAAAMTAPARYCSARGVPFKAEPITAVINIKDVFSSLFESV